LKNSQHAQELGKINKNLNLSPTAQPIFLMLGIFSSFGDFKKKKV